MLWNQQIIYPQTTIHQVKQCAPNYRSSTAPVQLTLSPTQQGQSNSPPPDLPHGNFLEANILYPKQRLNTQPTLALIAQVLNAQNKHRASK